MTIVNDRDWSDVEHKLIENKCVVLDNFLSNETCNLLHTRMIKSEKFHDNYIGYSAIDYNLEDSLTKQIVDDLYSKSEKLFGNFVRAWSFVYDNEASGVDIHSDPSNYNINIWVTPNESVKDKYSNGLNVYNVMVPKEANRAMYNKNIDNYLKDLVYANPHVIFRIPYRFNRAILFDASLPHETDKVSMLPGQENKRVSYTMLYGQGPFTS